jgi:Flp pilus assembly protein TadG
MIRRLIRSARSDEGTATIELAIVAPVLAMMVAGVADLSVAYGRKLEIEQAAQRAIEKVMQTTGSETPADEIKREACIQINGSEEVNVLDANGAVTGTTTVCKAGRISIADVDATYTLTCNGVSQAYTTDCTAGQVEVRYIEATVHDVYEPIFPITWGTGSDGVYQLSATAGVRVT